jgi:DNA-binding transcriptional ArsR family regulator
MRAKREFRSREETEVAVLDALVDRSDEGMTVLELRTEVDVEIDTLEEALSSLNDDELIDTERSDGQLVILPVDRVIPDEQEKNQDQSMVNDIRDKLPF